jgi:hypothetical protein
VPLVGTPVMEFTATKPLSGFVGLSQLVMNPITVVRAIMSQNPLALPFFFIFTILHK